MLSLFMSLTILHIYFFHNYSLPYSYYYLLADESVREISPKNTEKVLNCRQKIIFKQYTGNIQPRLDNIY